MIFGAAHCGEIFGLLALMPIAERLARLIQLVEDDQVLDIIFQGARPR